MNTFVQKGVKNDYLDLSLYGKVKKRGLFMKPFEKMPKECPKLH